MKDILTYLMDAFKKDQQPTPEVEAFVTWSQDYLLKRPPNSVFAASYGIGLRLSDGTLLNVLKCPGVNQTMQQDNRYYGIGGTMDYTMPQMEPDTSVPVFGNPGK
jgi:hypothetical protein